MNRGLLGGLAVGVLMLAGLMAGRMLWPRSAPAGLELHGNVDIRTVDLGFRVGGRIQSIAFDEGQRVSAGEVLAALDPAPMRDAAAASAAAAAAAGALARRRTAGAAAAVAQLGHWRR